MKGKMNIRVRKERIRNKKLTKIKKSPEKGKGMRIILIKGLEWWNKELNRMDLQKTK